jgi:hypothetical protein
MPIPISAPLSLAPNVYVYWPVRLCPSLLSKWLLSPRTRETANRNLAPRDFTSPALSLTHSLSLTPGVCCACVCVCARASLHKEGRCRSLRILGRLALEIKRTSPLALRFRSIIVLVRDGEPTRIWTWG